MKGFAVYELLSVLLIVALCIICSYCMYQLKSVVYFEKHHTEDGKSRSIFFRLFVLKYINTSLVFFINNNSDILGRVFGINNVPTRRDIFTADWFNNVGVTLMLVQLGDIFLSHGFKCFQYVYFLYQRSTGTYLSQDELNRSYVGPSFELAFKYAQLMSTFFCCFTFSTGIPILYAFSAANIGLYYLVEKFLFIRLYRIPPHFSNVVGVFATLLVPYALVIHLGMSIWVLSDKGIFDSGSEVTLILVVLLLLLAMSVAAAWIFSVFSKQIMKVPYLPTYPSYLIYLPTYLPIYLPTHLLTYLPHLPTYPTYLPYVTYLPTYLSTYLLTYNLPIYLPTYLPTYLLTYLLTYLPTYLPTYLHTYLPTYLPTYLLTYLLTHLPTY